MARTSAAWVLGIVAIMTGLVGALLLTVIDPVMQAVFASSLWTADTTTGQNILTWTRDVWTYWPVFILLGILDLVWIETRQPT